MSLKQFLSTFVMALLITNTHAGEVIDTPVGYWKTIDETTGNARSIIHIWKADDNTLSGNIVKVFPNKNIKPNEFCVACKGEQHNVPIIGMVIISGLQSKTNRWDDGKILDPENGKLYSCSMRVADNGKKLNVHGYIGLPLLGRSQTWERIDLMSDK